MSTKNRIKFVVAYDGSEFRGWAPQRGQRTVHGTLTEAVRQVSGEDCEIYGASRTDSGANALGQVCHFDCEAPIPVERWPKAVNQVLPKDVSVLSARQVPGDFNSRFWADRRWYRYRIMTGERDPLRSRYAFHYSAVKLDVAAMQRAAKDFVGTHDFLAFSQLVRPGTNTVRQIHEFTVRNVKDEVWIDVTGSAFVRGMMRRMSGALWEIGRGARGPEDVARLLQKRKKSEIKWPTVLPACGLSLMKVFYGRHPSDHRGRHEDDDE
ncbi:MAG TPA: tRNA pseudouridine(38-40) synthase TruA [Fimbriimonadaceae bacterium]|nr:tRNA pseudouridine(38-40) synthase TruA [Fimbriimonadaceae bacterium]